MPRRRSLLGSFLSLASSLSRMSRRTKCPGCGHRWISRSGTAYKCPRCGAKLGQAAAAPRGGCGLITLVGYAIVGLIALVAIGQCVGPSKPRPAPPQIPPTGSSENPAAASHAPPTTAPSPSAPAGEKHVMVTWKRDDSLVSTLQSPGHGRTLIGIAVELCNAGYESVLLQRAFFTLKAEGKTYNTRYSPPGPTMWDPQTMSAGQRVTVGLAFEVDDNPKDPDLVFAPPGSRLVRYENLYLEQRKLEEARAAEEQRREQTRLEEKQRREAEQAAQKKADEEAAAMKKAEEEQPKGHTGDDVSGGSTPAPPRRRDGLRVVGG